VSATVYVAKRLLTMISSLPPLQHPPLAQARRTAHAPLRCSCASSPPGTAAQLDTRADNGLEFTASVPERCEEACEDVDTDPDVLIQLVGVKKSFGSRRILDGVSLTVRRGEAVGIIGVRQRKQLLVPPRWLHSALLTLFRQPSGTGKSTILRIMAGLLEPDEGCVYIRGQPRRGLVGDDDSSEALRIGMVFQSAALFDSLNVRENVGFTLYEHSSLSDEEIRRAACALLALRCVF